MGIVAKNTQGELADEARRLTTVVDAANADSVLRQCDVVLAWGWENLAVTCANFKGKVIGVSHGAPDLEFTRRINAAMAMHPGLMRAAVSEAAGASWGKTPLQKMSPLDVATLIDKTAVLTGKSMSAKEGELSNQAYDILVDKWTKDLKAIIPNGAEPNRCCPRSTRNALRLKYGIPVGKRVALYLGRFSPEKRPELLEQALDFLPADWMAVYAGTGFPADMHSPRNLILPFQEHPGDLLAAADVFVLPSRTEGHPIALNEAWLASIPTVYCRWDFAEEMERKHLGPLGVVVPVDVAPQNLAHAIEHARYMSAAQLEHVRSVAWNHYTAPRMAAAWEQLILN